jgi:hypothetical protein
MLTIENRTRTNPRRSAPRRARLFANHRPTSAATAESGPYELLSDAAISICLKLAEGEGRRSNSAPWKVIEQLHAKGFDPDGTP